MFGRYPYVMSGTDCGYFMDVIIINAGPYCWSLLYRRTVDYQMKIKPLPLVGTFIIKTVTDIRSADGSGLAPCPLICPLRAAYKYIYHTYHLPPEMIVALKRRLFIYLIILLLLRAVSYSSFIMFVR